MGLFDKKKSSTREEYEEAGDALVEGFTEGLALTKDSGPQNEGTMHIEPGALKASVVIEDDTIGIQVTEFDPVQKPKGYNSRGAETIEVIKDQLSPEAYGGFLMGNLLKYSTRHEFKNGKEDLEKAQVYLQWLIDDYEYIFSQEDRHD